MSFFAILLQIHKIMGNCWTCLKTSEAYDTTGTTGQYTDPKLESMVGGTGTSSVVLNSNAGGVVGTSDAIPERSETDGLLSQSPQHFTNLIVESHLVKKPNPVHGLGTSTVDGTIDTAKQQSQVSDNTLNALFEEYKDAQEDAILSDGIERLCNDLGYKPDDFAILVLAWRLDASQMCRFTKTEFIQGLQTMSADTIDAARRRLEAICDRLQTDGEMFKQLYRFTFMFGLDPGYRIVSLDMAIILWRLVFTVHTPDILERWLHFLEQHPNIRGIPKDTWNMFLNFAETCDITAYDDTEAWPSLFDDFVEYETDRCNQNDTKVSVEISQPTAVARQL